MIRRSHFLLFCQTACMMVCAPGAAWSGASPTAQKAGAPAPQTPASILLITVDTLRADHLGCYGYFRDTSPNIDALARDSLLFTRACAPMATTFPSHLSLFTGVYPSEHGYLSNTRLIEASFEPTAKLRSVTQMLKDAGYATAAFVSAAPVRDSTGLGIGFDFYSQPEKDDWKLAGQRRADETVEAFVAWLAASPKEPFFAWIHLFDPHWPYDAPAPYARRYTTDERLKTWVAQRCATMTFPDKWKTRDALDVYNRYDGEVRFMDEQVGRALSALRESGREDRAILILTADHGEGLGQHDWPAHGDLHEEQMHVPLMIRFPREMHRAPGRVESVVSLVDVFPTVLAAMGSPAAAEMRAQASGLDVLAPDFKRDAVFSERTDHSEGWGPGRRFALTGARWRYYHLTEGRSELYDLTADPHELLNKVEDEPRVAAAMKADLLARLERFAQRAAALAEGRTPGKNTADSKMKEQLRGLGYVENEEEAGDDAPRTRPPATSSKEPAPPKP
ncbi:MAG: sulfatase [Phycisphaerales bacterium]|nr:sulfatase [Phycisphaerales bacterium]